MKFGIVFDNNVTKALVAPFESLKDAMPGCEFTVFVGEKNKNDVSSITLPIRPLSHKKEFIGALREPLQSFKRLKSNTESRMDFYYNSLKGGLRGFDAVFSQDVTRSLYTLAALKDELGFKIILRWWEVLPYKRLFNAKDEQIGAAALGKVDLFVPATKLAGDALLLEGVEAGRIHQIYPGIDTASFTPEAGRASRSAFGIPEDRFAVLFAGRIISHKGIYVLLWAALRLKAMGMLDKAVFVVAGGGRRDELMRLAGEMGVGQAFHFAGHVPYQRMPELYGACDAFCLPSTMKETIQEQFGYVIIEAMACGRPVVASRVGAIPEVVGGAGLLVIPGDWNDLANALASLIRNPAVCAGLGAKSRARAMQTFDIRRISVEWRGLIERLA